MKNTLFISIIRFALVGILGFGIGYGFGQNYILKLSAELFLQRDALLAKRTSRSDLMWQRIEQKYANGNTFKLEPELGWNNVNDLPKKFDAWRKMAMRERDKVPANGDR